MEVFFYKTSDVSNKLEKTLADEKIFNAVLKESMYLSTIHIILNGQIDSFGYNYCYAPKLKRYYFVEKINIMRNNLIEIDLIEDVLMTYKDKILESKCEIVECENNYDNENVTYTGKEVFTENIFNGNNPFLEHSSIIMIASN